MIPRHVLYEADYLEAQARPHLPDQITGRAVPPTLQARHTTYATDIHGRPSRVRAVWDNPFSQEDR